GQPKRSHPFSVPGDEITLRIRGCHVPNKDILITLTVGPLQIEENGVVKKGFLLVEWNNQ
ncbi:MAG: hypothetical protein L0Z71_17825, partial [Anaerolineae bacterium]|nr:hypothetical protein [Anaerolineae bacterium]